VVVSALETALEGLKKPAEAVQDAMPGGDEEDDDDSERDEEDEEDDEEDSGPRGEQEEPGRPAPRGEQDEAGPHAGETGDDDDADADEEEPGEESERVPRATADEDTEDEADEAAHATNGHHADASVELVRHAREQLAELVGRRPETVSRVERHEGVWELSLEVVELERIPHSTDVLASYDVALDDDGHLLHYARTRRYYRNRAEEAV
jgi:hypothetical protein